MFHYRRMIAFILQAVILAAGQAAAVPFAKDDFHIYLLIGQSNMAGRAAIESIDRVPVDNAYLFDSSKAWIPAANPLNQFSTVRKSQAQGLNPGWTFARDIAAANPGIGIGIVCNARGGTDISSWQKGGWLYNAALGRIQAAMPSGTLKGILWHQGESDLGDTDGLYLARLRQLVADLRTDLGMPGLPFIAGEVGQWRSAPVNDAINRLPDSVANTAVASSDGLTDKGDNSHFDSRSQRILGERYAVKALVLVYGDTLADSSGTGGSPDDTSSGGDPGDTTGTGGTPGDTVDVGGIGVTSSSDDGNVAANTLDGDFDTRWSANGGGEWIQFDLGTTKSVTGVAIAFYRGDERSSMFDVNVSDDGHAWTGVLTGSESGGVSLGLEAFPFGAATDARYVRIIGHGNSDNDWNSYTEVRIDTAAGTSGVRQGAVDAVGAFDGVVGMFSIHGNLIDDVESMHPGVYVGYDAAGNVRKFVRF